MNSNHSRRPRPLHAPPASYPARAAVILVASLLLVLGLTGCGSSGEDAATAAPDGSATTATATDGADTTPGVTDDTSEADQQAFSDCLAEQGLQLPDDGFAGGGPGGQPPDGSGTPPSMPDDFDPAAMEEAMAICGDLRPEGGPAGGALSEVDQEAMRVYRSCLDDNGVTLPTFGAPGDTTSPTTGEDAPPSIDVDDPDVAAALDTCEPLLPEGFDPAAGSGFPGGPPPGAGSSPTNDTDTSTDGASS